MDGLFIRHLFTSSFSGTIYLRFSVISSLATEQAPFCRYRCMIARKKDPGIPLDAPHAGVVYIISMRKILIVSALLALSLPAFASDWAVRFDHADVRKGPSIKGIMVYTLRKSQFAKITDIGKKGGWIKVRFSAYISRKAYARLREKGAEIKRLGKEGDLVQVNISGWTKKDGLRER